MSATTRILVHGRSEPFEVDALTPVHLRVGSPGGADAIDVNVSSSGDGWRLTSPAWSGAKRTVTVDAGTRIWVLVDGRAFECERVAADTGSRGAAPALDDTLRSPMPATVVRVPVAVGAIVEKDAVLVVLEAMKMELAIKAPHACTVTRVSCEPGQLVSPDDVLVTLGPHP